MNPTFKGALYTASFFIGSEILYQLYKRFFCTKNEIESESRLSKTSLQVLFFPDQTVACYDFFISGDGCFKNKCTFSHSKTSLSELYRHMLSSRHTLDICVFILTCKDLAEILLKLHKRGVKVRIITDNEMLHSDGSQIWNLQKAGRCILKSVGDLIGNHRIRLEECLIDICFKPFVLETTLCCTVVFVLYQLFTY